jgi:site-specific recombinase XerD
MIRRLQLLSQGTHGQVRRQCRQSVPVIPTLAKILDEHRASMHNPGTGVIFHSGNGEHMDMDKLAQRVIRPAVEACGLPWYGWHGFRRGIASNLYELGANDKIVQRVLRHAKPHVTREKYIKAFDSGGHGSNAANAGGSEFAAGLASSWPADELTGM